MIERQLNAPLTSSAGRLFDAVASLVGVRDRAGYEGQAASELEALATRAEPDSAYPFALDAVRDPLQADTRPLIGAIVADVRHGVSREVIARRFHSTLVEVIAEVCKQLRDRTGLNAVVLSGGVFLNAILLTESLDRLVCDGFRVYRHAHVPPGDGGLCLGQLAVAAALQNCDDLPSPLT
jgi:hydrogenase maturation protein HypF